jgi:UDP-glucose 4-epimerase
MKEKNRELILVTGGTGYIGSHTTVELMEAGHDVLVIDNFSNSRIEVLDGIEKIAGRRPSFEKLDLRHAKEVNRCFSKYPDIRAIIHFAASKAVNESVEKPLLYYENNLMSLINLLNAMNQHGTRYFVFSSSCTVYGQPDTLPVTEESPIKKASSPYGNTKQISEEIIEDTIISGDPVEAISLRYFNPIGAHPSALIGELPIGIPNNLVPFITQTAIGIRKELSVFGDDYNTPDGSAIRDYINVVDLSKAHVVAIDRLLSGKNQEKLEVFNLGTGMGLSVLEIVQAFRKATGVDLNYRIVDRREGDVEKVYADTSLANKVLKWKAETPLEDTLRSAWEWEKYIRSQ